MGAVGDYLYPHLHNLVWDPADPRRVYATSPIGGWVSDDAGMTWAPLSPDTPNLHYGRTLLVPGSHTLYLYRWGDPGLFRSDDMGAAWARGSDAMYYQVALVPGSPQSLYALHGDWRLRRSDDGGRSWRDLAQPRVDAQETVFAVASSGALYAIAGRQLFVSGDGGASWAMTGVWPADARPRQLLVAADGSLIASIASDDMPSVSAKAIWRSADGGHTWAAAPLPAARIAVLTLGDDGTLWAGSDDGHVWHIRNLVDWAAPVGWAELPLQLAQPTRLRDDIPYTPAITDISPGPGGVVLIGTIHGIYRAATPAGPALLRARGLLPTAALPSAAVAAPSNPQARYFPQTGHSIREPFLSPWRRAGGVLTLGLPRSEPFLERNLDSGQDELVQYFERGRLGMPLGHPEASSLGRIAPALMAEDGLRFASSPAQPGCAAFDATGQSVCAPFLGAWRADGGLGYLGYPLSPAVDTASGRGQWFERGRLEIQSPGGPYLCLVGNEELQRRGWLP
jgi:photosystem II stability/assembly factor-like uncharacterized protein